MSQRTEQTALSFDFCGDKLFGHRYDDKNRFMRVKDYGRCNYITCKSPVIKAKSSIDGTMQPPLLCEAAGV